MWQLVVQGRGMAGWGRAKSGLHVAAVGGGGLSLGCLELHPSSASLSATVAKLAGETMKLKGGERPPQRVPIGFGIKCISM